MGGSLSRREFDAVIRRAAELAAADPDVSDGSLTEEDLFRIAGEVGLGEPHVRQALAEVRSGIEGGGVLDRIFGPIHVSVSRVVPGSSDAVSASIDEFLVASQLLQPVHRSAGKLQYRPAVDWASQLARAASFGSSRYYVASARSVEVDVEPMGQGGSRVGLLVDPGTRGEKVAEAIVGGGLVGAVVGAGLAWAVASVAPLLLGVVIGGTAAAGVWSGVVFAVGASHRRKVDEVRAELEGVLGALEAGDRLEPPPPSWRRWVKRYFHGMARDFSWEGSRRGKGRAEDDARSGPERRSGGGR